MKKILKAALMGAIVMAPATSFAQTALNSGYFSDNYVMRHELNPALAPTRNYVAVMPLIGGTNIAFRSNIGIDNVLFPTANGQLTTFMNKDVSGSFIDDLSKNNNIGFDMNLNILSVGFQQWGGFNTIGLSLRTSLYANLPKGLFEFMKFGQNGQESSYSFDNLGFEADSYMELALGHQRRINDEWTVGGKLKFLFGVAHADMSVENMTMTLSDDYWMVDANGEMNIAMKGVTLPTHQETGTTKAGRDRYNKSFDFKELKSDGFGMNGFGMALDLGATYKAPFAEGLELSASVLDLGFINYGSNIQGVMDNNDPWRFDGFTICSMENKPGHEHHPTFADQIDTMTGELGDYLNFKRSDKESRSRMLAATVNVGASYELPAYRRLKFGFLSSTRINGEYSWSEGRFSANINPFKGFDFAVNYAISSFGSSLGWLINYATNGFGLYLGMDHTLTEITPQGIPTSGNANVAFGIVFPLGARK